MSAKEDIKRLFGRNTKVKARRQNENIGIPKPRQRFIYTIITIDKQYSEIEMRRLTDSVVDSDRGKKEVHMRMRRFDQFYGIDLRATGEK